MKSNPPTKSLFAPIKPRIVPIVSAPAPAPAPAKTLPVSSVEPPTAPKKEDPRPESSESKATPEQPSRLEEPLPKQVEIWLEVADKTGRASLGWGYLARRDDDTRAIIVVVNKEHWLVKRSLEQSDARTITLLASVALAETLQIRKRKAFVEATLEELRKVVLTKEQQTVWGAIFLGSILAEHPLMKAIPALPIYGEQVSPEPRHWIETIKLQPPEPNQ